ncbi:MAG TPA: hypothetical protein VKZ18_23435 [Polyangia bacterium]|nr:hypothetical protein [Polyangia bacterium]
MPGAGGGAGIDTSRACLNCADQGLLCVAATGKCVSCLTNKDCDVGQGNPNAACLPNGTCGCTADSQCAGLSQGIRCIESLQQCGCESDADCSTPGALVCAASGKCGCGSNQDCASKIGIRGLPVPFCNTSSGACVECSSNQDCAGKVLLGTGSIPACNTSTGTCVPCVTDADCTDPNARACDPQINICLPCRTSADCAQSAAGPVCGNIGANYPGIGDCHCGSDSDCVGHSGGPHCVGTMSAYLTCGCVNAADCAGDVDGHACITPFDSSMRCGCATTADCPSGKTCSGSTSTCQ